MPQSARICAIGGVKLQFGQCPNIHGFSLGGASIGPLVEGQMLDVSKVKLLSERTSGVPPVIF